MGALSWDQITDREARARRAAGLLIGVCDVGSGPTDEQYAVVHGLVLGTSGVDLVDIAGVEPIPAQEAGTPSERVANAFLQAAITLEFCRHPPDPAMADNVEAYAAKVGIEVALQTAARDYLESELGRLMVDFRRHRGEFQEEVGELETSDAALAAELRGLAACGPGTLGRAFYDFHVEHGFRFAGERGGGERYLIPHDFAHVITGYPPDRHGEIAVNALVCASTGGERYFGSLCSSLALHEGGLFRSHRDNVPGRASLRDPDGVAMLADAIARGTESGRDPMVLDHMALVDAPLADVRRSLGLRERRDPKAPGG